MVESTSRRRWARICLAGLVLVLISCGRVPATGNASAARTVSPTSAVEPPSPSGPWQTYVDPQYGFSISYPPNFTFQSQGSGPPGGLQVYRAVDNRYLTGDPPGQVEIGLYLMDADTLQAWVIKHTGPAEASSNQEFYWGSATNVRTTTAAGRPALSFDYSSEGFRPPVHTTAFLQTPSRVMLIDWWSADPAYLATLEAVYQQMFTTLKT